MRATILGLFAAAIGLVAGCRTQPLDHPISDDFGNFGSPTDMAMSNMRRDLSVPNGMGCAALVTCVDGCFDQQCQNNCYAAASNDAQQTFGNAVDCVYTFCLTSSGKRGPRCVQAPDGTFIDPADGGVSGECNQCVSNAYAQLGGYPCQPTNDPDCNPQQCNGLVLMCLNN